MPVLSQRSGEIPHDVRVPADARMQGNRSTGGGILAACSNPRCESGWLHLLRSRSAPVFEGGWSCSAACSEERMRTAVRREMHGAGSRPAATYKHRMPLGLVMMEQGWITAGQLKQALEAQKAAGGGRIGQFLFGQLGVDESLVTRALSLQWSCPVLTAHFHDPEAVSPLMPRLFVDAFGALPLRVAAGSLLYLGFEERLDPELALAVERITGLRVECGLVVSSEFRQAQAGMLNAVYPRVELLEASSEPALVRALARAVERVRPHQSRLVRVHDCLWLRMWKKTPPETVPEVAAVEDVIGSIGV